jgi:AraC family transcriptional regulator of adaptative response/methylated-DNA-[protein]-cysteine methyltransferase
MLGEEIRELETALTLEFPAAALERNDRELKEYTEQIVGQLSGNVGRVLELDVPGTAFQWQVWEALRRIPPGETRSYQAIALDLGRPTAARAVARACASNRLAVVIPCHRAVRETGELGGYRWGPERKRQILEQERRRRDSRSAATMPAS